MTSIRLFAKLNYEKLIQNHKHMAYSLNKVQLIGNLTRDPEMRTTGSGIAVTSFSIATNQTWTDQAGNRQDKSEFHNIVAWRRLAEIVHQYARKGSKLYVEGKLQTREWEGEDGVKRYRTEVIADNLILLDSKGGTNQESSQNYSQSRDHQNIATPQNQPAFDPAEEVAIEDLPF